MIQKIGDNFAVKLASEKNVNKNSAIQIRNNHMSMPETLKYTPQNLRANYLPFEGKTPVTFTGSEDLFKVVAQYGATILPPKDSATENVSQLGREKLLKGDYYSQFNSDLSVLLGPDKPAIILHDNDTNPELIIHNFQKNLAAGKYDGIDLRSDYTDVVYIKNLHNAQLDFTLDEMQNELNDAIDNFLGKLDKNLPRNEKELRMEKFITDFSKTFNNKKGVLDLKSPLEVINDISKYGNEKTVLFIKDFENVLSEIYAYGYDDGLKKFLNKIAPGVNVVGLMSKETYEAHQASPKGQLLLSAIKDVDKISTSGLNADQAKDFLKKNPKFIKDIFSRYENARLKISYNAIDKLVERSSTSIEGTFPAKALRMLDYIAAAKMNESNTLYVNDGYQRITTKDIDNFFVNHAPIIESVRPKNEKLQIAENVKTKFKDVGGLDTAKEDLQEVLDFLKNPKKYLASGRKKPGGKLLVGPPGTGKTLLAKAVAGEADVPFVYMNGTDFGSQYINSGPMDVKKAFAQVREIARQNPKKSAIFFIDEVDVLGRKRGSEGNAGSVEDAKTTNAFINELDGFASKDSDLNIMVIAATNRKEVMDPALTDRPSRLGQDVLVDLPKLKKDRRAILDIHAAGKPFASEAEKDRILNEFADITEGMNGDKISQAIDQAMGVMFKRKDNHKLTYNDMFEGFMNALRGKRIETDFSLADRKSIAVHEFGHISMHDILKFGKVTFVSNEARGSALGTTYITPEKSFTETFKSIVKEIAALYSGGDAEVMVNGHHGSGVSNDYMKITNYIDYAIKRGGLGVYTPQISFVDGDGNEIKELVDMYKNEIKKDHELYSNLGHKISRLGLEFQRDFLFNTYLPIYDAEIASGKGGNSYSGDQFRELKGKWLKDKNKVKAEDNFRKFVDDLIDKEYLRANKELKKISKTLKYAVKDDKNFFTRTAKKLARII